MDKLQQHLETSAQRKSPPPPQAWRSFLQVSLDRLLLVEAAVAGVMTFLFAGMAFAQAAAGAPAGAELDPMLLLQQIFDAVHNGNGWLAAGPTLTLVVFLIRKYDTKIPKVGPALDAFLNEPLVAFMLPAVLSAAVGLFGALGQHLPVGPALLTALKVAGTAAFTFLLAKNTAEQINGAQAAGTAAAKNPGPTLGA